MDTVEYSGLRQYLLSKKPRKDRVHRELWEYNGATYNAYRKYLNHVREFGFPDEQGLLSPSLAVTARQTNPFGQSRPQTAQAFSGVNAIIDGCQSAISCMVYGCLSTTIVAVGTVDGGVWVLHLNRSGHRLNKLLDHEAEVRDVDWSKDNSLLLSCSFNGCVCLTNVEVGKVYRKWVANTRTTSCKQGSFKKHKHDLTCRFHPLNQNLLIVGGGGSIYIFNCSTGAQVQRMTLISSQSVHITEMVCTGSLMLLGDSSGALRAYKMKFSSNLLQLVSLGNTFVHPFGMTGSVTGIDIRAYSNACKGQAAVVSYEDSSLAVYKIGISVHPKVELFTKLAMTPIGRRVKAVWCPAMDIDQPEHIAIGGEHANVHVYHLTGMNPPVLVNALSAHEAPVMTVCWSYDGQELISGDENGTLIVWKQKSKGKTVYHSIG